MLRCMTQAGLHEQYGGVKPDVARDAHAEAIHSTGVTVCDCVCVCGGGVTGTSL